MLRIHCHALDQVSLIHEQVVAAGATEIPLRDGAINFRQHGALTIELEALSEPFTFLEGAWLDRAAVEAATGLAAVFCTFNREDAITRVLATLADEPAVVDCLARVIVVNQGRPGLRQHPAFLAAAAVLGERLRLLEQVNFGGAGGFTRGMLEVLDDPAVTHVALLDDDIELEPDGLLRMSAFFTRAKRDVVLGGQMLDLLHPTLLYEAGAVVTERHWAFQPQHHGLPLDNASMLQSLSLPSGVFYNGWWCCGFPVSALRQHGLPLPCFIRGDDVEFGLRLAARGIPTVPMPGIAVWHEPFYLKIGHWQLYYETRNLLIAAALHLPFGAASTVRRIGRLFAMHLLTLRYYSAALILEGVRDFLAGPAVLRQPPLPRHASLGALKQRYPSNATAREQPLAPQRLRPVPRGPVRSLLLLGRLALRNAIIPTRIRPPALLKVRDLNWVAMRGVEHIAVETWWDDQRPTFHRSREHHRDLLRQAVRLLVRLYREGPAAAKAWQSAAPELTSEPYWREYLGLTPRPPSQTPREAAARQTAPTT